MNIVDVVNAFSPIICAVISIFTYSTLTSYRLDRIEESVRIISNLDKRVTILEEKFKNVEKRN